MFWQLHLCFVLWETAVWETRASSSRFFSFRLGQLSRLFWAHKLEPQSTYYGSLGQVVKGAATLLTRSCSHPTLTTTAATPHTDTTHSHPGGITPRHDTSALTCSQSHTHTHTHTHPHRTPHTFRQPGQDRLAPPPPTPWSVMWVTVRLGPRWWVCDLSHVWDNPGFRGIFGRAGCRDSAWHLTIAISGLGRSQRRLSNRLRRFVGDDATDYDVLQHCDIERIK